ncbi:MAG: UTP--glucose-1-phosphate uridylyltransferase, partial [Fibrobacter sp.]|nr:UTP--glucose-1-phosphate uridylyltransferase [Fibrobacter sp.]
MDIIKTLKAAGQQELVAKLESLTGEARSLLERDILSQDWEELKSLYAEKSAATLADNVSADLKPMPFKIAADDLRYDFWKETGEILLQKGQVA